MGITTFLQKLFGSKSDRDIKEIAPLVESINAEFNRITGFTNDELRFETDKIREKIRNFIKAEEEEIADLKVKAEEVDIEQSEKIYDRIDKLTETIDVKLEEVLNEVLPTAFAIVKDTARRVEIEGDYAIWHNHWMAGGNEVTWDMVHYDVQLIGGVALHKGSIAEMGPVKVKPLLLRCPFF
jgi:preprotein translocase subunit SecA